MFKKRVVKIEVYSNDTEVVHRIMDGLKTVGDVGYDLDRQVIIFGRLIPEEPVS